MPSLVAPRKLRPPVKTHGGKSYLARRIISVMPGHRVYLEPFLGGGSVLLNRLPADVEVAGDVNDNLVNFWTVLRDDPLLAWRLEVTPYDRDFFDKSIEYADNPDPLVRAWAFVVRNRMSRGGIGKVFSWSDRTRGKTRPGGPIPEGVNSWETFIDSLPDVRRRIQRVAFRCSGAIPLIRDHDASDVLIYCDPPYLKATRTAPDVYAHEMSAQDHIDFLGAVVSCRATVMVSGYDHPLYRDRLAGWACHRFDMPNHSGQGKTKQRRVECLWVNRPS
jgi:DNA adenine methylase